MWTINSYDIFLLRTPGGDRFTEFVDELIRAEARIEGVPLSEISTNLRTNLGDKGVDTEVRQALPANCTGWMGVPTCWQYKATEFKNIKDSALCQEVKKAYSKELIQKGYGYRLCICDDLPHKSARLILVTDECLLETHQKLKRILDRDSNRVRVICIDNSGERLGGVAEQLWLERIPEENVDSILKQNFPLVPLERRYAYVRLSRGFIRLAADLCNQDSVAAQGNLGSVRLVSRNRKQSR
jgi:hypothetical protein